MLVGDIVYLRPFTRADLVVFDGWANDPAYTSEYNNFGLVRSGSLEGGFNHTGLIDSQHGMLVVALRSDGSTVGDVSYHQERYGPNEGSLAYNIGITLAPEHRGKGYGSEAQRLLAAYLLATYPIMRIEAATDITNIPEQRSLEKAGFTREGIARKSQWRGGVWHDLVIYSKLRGE